MVGSISHKGLRRFFETGDARGVPSELALRIRIMLSAVHVAEKLDELKSVPGWRLHQLKGNLQGFWNLSVSGNWRIIFRFANGTATDVDLIDYTY